jgi:hypothetical protein
MKDYRKKIEILKDDIIDDIISITQKKGKHFGHHFIIVEDNKIFRAVRYKQDLEFTWRKYDNYKHLSIEMKGDSNKYYVIDSKEGEVHESHFDARIISVDILYHILETIKTL